MRVIFRFYDVYVRSFLQPEIKIIARFISDFSRFDACMCFYAFWRAVLQRPVKNKIEIRARGLRKNSNRGGDTSKALRIFIDETNQQKTPEPDTTRNTDPTEEKH